ncbi:hypothetical protein I302_102499 [Kwoniella bestiolae CBS 10118]|uniref:CENP-V/GFA domain-containing protein n=1 Tax=Kwoniella bestiolae CBS 10118 TaxID=1296100 RepID=A0A1B9GFA6_9TREE|nr:hypothetical protein I302_01190 [Kwoniella bestiolae CBS 10118]OCF29678.1 hypothetical protein I302_01190 [Kwoniella bestiolae CBS 10118]
MSTDVKSRGDSFIPPNNSLTHDGWSNEDEATATCFCGKVQLVVPLKSPGLVNTFACNCVDCRKVTASMFATNFTTLDSHTRFSRGEDHLTTFSQDKTTESGKTMTNGFCRTCGTLMYRKSDAYPGTRFLRVGTVDDLNLHQTVLKPKDEMFVATRVGWWDGVKGAKQWDGVAGG